ncbi:hypothetical protein BH18THE2_BH18THE2_25470 [soil metagenome]
MLDEETSKHVFQEIMRIGIYPELIKELKMDT